MHPFGGRRLKPLHKILSVAVDELLEGMELSPYNCQRYLTRDVLRKYRIGPDVAVTVHDWKLSIEIAKQRRRERYLSSLSSYDRQQKQRLERATGKGPSHYR
jgi:hypothetical protein